MDRVVPAYQFGVLEYSAIKQASRPLNKFFQPRIES